MALAWAQCCSCVAVRDDNGSHFLTRDPSVNWPVTAWPATTHESWLPTTAVSSQDHRVEVLSKSNIITATKYSVETTVSWLNWRCGLSCAVSPYNVWKTRNHGSTGHVTHSDLLTHLTRDPLSSLVAAAVSTRFPKHIMGQNIDMIHKARCEHRRARTTTSPGRTDRATTMGSMHRKFGKARDSSFRDMLADGRTDRHKQTRS